MATRESRVEFVPWGAERTPRSGCLNASVDWQSKLRSVLTAGLWSLMCRRCYSFMPLFIALQANVKLSFLERMLAAPPPDPAKQAAAAAKSGATGPPADPPHLTLGLQVRMAAIL